MGNKMGEINLTEMILNIIMSNLDEFYVYHHIETCPLLYSKSEPETLYYLVMKMYPGAKEIEITKEQYDLIKQYYINKEN